MATHPSVASSARTTSGNTTAISLGRLTSTVSVLLSVTAASGTGPSLIVDLQWSHDNVTWYSVDPSDTFTAVTTTAALVRTFTVRAPNFRIRWVISGTTPSFTFAADTVYAREGRME